MRITLYQMDLKNVSHLLKYYNYFNFMTLELFNKIIYLFNLLLGKKSGSSEVFEDLIIETLRASKEQDEIDGFLVMLGNNLRKLSVKKQRALVMKFLNEVYSCLDELEDEE